MSQAPIHPRDHRLQYEVLNKKFIAENGYAGVFPSKTPVLWHILQRARVALQMLYEAAIYAQDTHHSIWDFSLELPLLRERGLAHSDLRWLLCKGVLEHAEEVDCGDSNTRCFRPMGSLAFCPSSCFVLTEMGQSILRRSLVGVIAPSEELIGLPAAPYQLDSDRLQVKPYWDQDRQELRIGQLIVKQFKVPAPNQEIVLAAFHEENWPVRIDDPLPPRADLEPKRRLHDTINSLNRHQKSDLMRFLGDGSGQGVRWEFGVRAQMTVLSPNPCG